MVTRLPMGVEFTNTNMVCELIPYSLYKVATLVTIFDNLGCNLINMSYYKTLINVY